MLRLISGVVLAVVVLAAILFLPAIGLRVVACLVAGLAAHEYLRIVGTDSRPVLLAIVLCWFVSVETFWSVEVVSIAALVWVAADVLTSGNTLQQTVAGAFAGVYIGVPLGMLAATHAIAGWPAALLVIGTVIVSDSAQFYTGRLFGRHALAPAISPKKTIEGAVGGLVVGTLFMAMAGARVVPSATYAGLAALGVVVVVAGICGDLFESRLKRVAGVKDSSHLIPGHGGVLDRIDALLFAAPPFYFFMRTVS